MKEKVEDFDEELVSPVSDQTDQLGSPVNSFIHKHGKTVIIICIAVVVLVGLAMLLWSNSQKNEQNAMKALARVEGYYMRSEYDNALYAPDSLPVVRGERVIGLVKIVDEYGTTKAGERASLFAADSYYQLGKYPEAKTYYEKAINASNDEIKIGGYAGTAACDEKDGKLQDASANYLKAAELITDDGLRQRYLYFSALCDEKIGDKERALDTYRQIVDLNKYGEFNNLAKAGIVRLGSDIE